MQDYQVKLPKGDGTVIVRLARQQDIPALIDLNKRCFPSMVEEGVVWRESHLRSHMELFNEGQIVVEYEGRVIGAVHSLIVSMGRDALRSHTYAGITDGGYFYNHDSDGDTLYGADVYVDPDYRSMGIGGILYEARRQLCQHLNLRRILAGGRLWNYCDHAEEMSAEEYARRVEAGDLNDLVLSFQLKQGFSLRGVLHNYIPDPRSLNNASLIEWLNPDYRPDAQKRSKVRVACVQYQVRKISSFEDFADQVVYFTETAADYRSDFLVFPEFFSVQLLSLAKIDALSSLEGIRQLSGFTDQFIDLMGGLALKYGMYIIAGSHPIEVDGKLYNKSLVFQPDGSYVGQPKLHITPSERKYWGISGGDELFVFQSPKVKFGVQICYDIEFPESARYLADQGVEMIFVPYCTDNRQGYLRVRHCAQARAIENQIYVVTAGIIGNLPSVPAMDIHYGQAAVFTPSDFEFARDGIQAEADSNVETLLITDLDIGDLHRSRDSGSVTPRRDRRHDLFEFHSRLKNKPVSPSVDRATPMDLV